MRLIELIRETQFFLIEEALLRLYPNQENNMDGYAEVYENLLLSEVIESAMIVHANNIEDKEEGLNWVDISGTDGSIYCEDMKDNHPKEWDGTLIVYALEFRPWKEWLGFNVCEKSLENLGPVDYLAHILYEVTFLGFDEECVEESREDLRKAKDELTEHIESGRDLSDFTISLDDIIKEIEEKDE